jgi:hypothetical protein
MLTLPMRPAHLWLLALLTLGQCTPPADAPQALPGRPVPTAWVEKLRRYGYQTDNLALLKEFEGIIAPDTLAGASDLPHEVNIADPEPRGLLNCLFVNLDDDPATEMLGVFGYHHSDLTLGVFKEIDHSWRLLYTESFRTHDTPAELQVGNTFSVHKPFYIGSVLGWGSGVYFSQYRIYKLIDNQVYPCLQLVDEAFSQGGTMSKEVYAKLQFDATYADGLTVTFDYRFSPGFRLRPGNPWLAYDGVAFVQGKSSIGYHWNDSARRYAPDKPYVQEQTGAMLDSTDLTAAKLAYFEDTDNDSLFITAFGYELRQLRREGSPELRMLLKKYLDVVRQDQIQAQRSARKPE